MQISRVAKPLAVVFFGAVLAACQTTASRHDSLKTSALERGGETQIVVMTPDVELTEIQASGLERPMADWTEAAEGHVRSAIDRCFGQFRVQRVHVQAGDLGPEAQERIDRLNNLHAAVSSSIFAHQLLAVAHLPGKAQRFDWTLGPGASAIGEAYGARYGLYIFIRDSYASAERAAVMAATMIIGALAGVSISPTGGTQVGYASLVDLESGEVLWFNRLLRGKGDLRESIPAQETVAHMLADFPYGTCVPEKSGDDEDA